jgi:hypothetical protein
MESLGAWALGLGAVSIDLCAYTPFTANGPRTLVLSAPITLAFALSLIFVVKGRKGQESLPGNAPL